jgi:BirA family biotin operon repressor/biotin-[acetyl-CoA-carboxylase] ligase
MKHHQTVMDMSLAKAGDVPIQPIIRDLQRCGLHQEGPPDCGSSFASTGTALDGERIRRGLTTRYLGRHLVLLAETGSTNDVALALAGAKVPGGTVVIADHQTWGRGRAGRIWQATPGSHLFMSAILYPTLAAEYLPALTLGAGVAVADAIIACTGLPAVIKWPNDILIGNRKVCGILSESRFCGSQLEHVVVGIGINVNGDLASMPEGIRSTATTLAAEAGRELSREDLLGAIWIRWEHILDEMSGSGFASVLDRWRHHAAILNRRVVISGPQGSLSGTAVDIDARGVLLVVDDQGRRIQVCMGDVSLRPVE